VAGRKPKPTKLKVLQGNPGKRALPKNEPEPTGELGDAPFWLSAEAVEYWQYAVDTVNELEGVAKKPDEAAVAMFAQAIADYREADDALADNGSNYQNVETKAGGVMTRIHPAVGVRRDAMAQIMKICGEFGLTPSARTKVRVDLGDKDKNPNDKYFA
jgi:P27 family predicted phage terminase small subunit